MRGDQERMCIDIGEPACRVWLCVDTTHAASRHTHLSPYVLDEVLDGDDLRRHCHGRGVLVRGLQDLRPGRGKRDDVID